MEDTNTTTTTTPASAGTQTVSTPVPATTTTTPSTVIQQAPIDYEKLSQIVAGKQEVTEDLVLKGFFKQQGLSKEEMEQAISTFKTQKAASQPNIDEIQRQAEKAIKEAADEKIKNAAIMMSEELGIELKNVAPVLKLADLSDSIGKDGAVDKEKLKVAMNKVLKEIPVFKTNGTESKKPQFVRGTQGAHHPQQETKEAAYLNSKYKNNPYYKGIGGQTE